MDLLLAYLHYLLSKLVSIFHIGLITTNIIAIPLLIIHEPFWIWMPLITVMCSPLFGGVYCPLNRMENYFRRKSGQEQIVDKLTDIIQNKRI